MDAINDIFDFYSLNRPYTRSYDDFLHENVKWSYEIIVESFLSML